MFPLPAKVRKGHIIESRSEYIYCIFIASFIYLDLLVTVTDHIMRAELKLTSSLHLHSYSSSFKLLTWSPLPNKLSIAATLDNFSGFRCCSANSISGS